MTEVGGRTMQSIETGKLKVAGLLLCGCYVLTCVLASIVCKSLILFHFAGFSALADKVENRLGSTPMERKYSSRNLLHRESLL